MPRILIPNLQGQVIRDQEIQEDGARILHYFKPLLDPGGLELPLFLQRREPPGLFKLLLPCLALGLLSLSVGQSSPRLDWLGLVGVKGSGVRGG